MKRTFTMIITALAMNAGAAVPELDALRTKAEEQLAGIEKAHAASTGKLGKAYLAKLEKLYQKLKLIGEVEPVVAIRDERKRFLADGDLDITLIVESPAELKALQESMLKQLDALKAKRNEREDKLNWNYLKRLLALKKHLTMNNRIKDATVVDFAAKQVKATLPDEPRAPAPETPDKAPGADASRLTKSGLPAAGLSLHFDFESVSKDLVKGKGPHAHTGRLVAPAAWTKKGRHGGGLELNSGSSAVVIPDHESLNMEKEMTVAMWVKFDGATDTGKNWYPLLSKGSHNTRSYTFQLNRWRECEASTKSPGKNWMTRLIVNIPVREWFHIAWSVNHAGGWMRFYLDGEEVINTVSPFATFRTSARGLVIGRGDGMTPTFVGEVDEAVVYKRALSAPEIGRIRHVTAGGSGRPPAVKVQSAEGPWPGSERYRGHTYKIFRIHVPFYAAQEQCKKLGGHLAVIESKSENRFIAKMGQGFPLWIGAERVDDKTFKWVDGSKMSYENWRDEEPNNFNGNEDTVVMGRDGTWLDHSSESWAPKGFVCEWDEPPPGKTR